MLQAYVFRDIKIILQEAQACLKIVSLIARGVFLNENNNSVGFFSDSDSSEGAGVMQDEFAEIHS